jgi:hypothetical protein
MKVRFTRTAQRDLAAAGADEGGVMGKCSSLSPRHCERSEAIHSFFSLRLWIASLRSQ